MDLFNVEQAISLTMGELVKQLSGGYPELIVLVLSKVCFPQLLMTFI